MVGSAGSDRRGSLARSGGWFASLALFALTLALFAPAIAEGNLAGVVVLRR